MAVKKRKTISKYAKLIKAKSSWCAGRITKKKFNEVAKAYKVDAVDKGNKTKSQANAVVAKLEKKACKQKAKKKTTAKRKTTKRKTAKRKTKKRR